ncbi:protein ARV1-like [Ctenocephalides felis]|uniref:protein ARV1-like n=1 Tax=Ctenocephalides felis TaxID=7515 RepID=UPI000E6E3CD0|nr:protein ARV1-like [Ctenocephalides felis]
MISYICINCGHGVKELSKKYSQSVLKICTCPECSQIADKYIEYDTVIILIDLILLSKPAYRHILYNTTFQNYWKIALLVVIMEAYTEWAMSNTSQKENFIEDSDFYINCIHVIIGTILFMIIAYFVHNMVNIVQPKNIVQKVPYRVGISWMWKSLTLSSFGKFLMLPSLIWGDNSVTKIHWLLVFGYTTISQLLVYSVISGQSRSKSMLVIFLALIGKLYAMSILKQHVTEDIFSFLAL